MMAVVAGVVVGPVSSIPSSTSLERQGNRGHRTRRVRLEGWEQALRPSGNVAFAEAMASPVNRSGQHVGAARPPGPGDRVHTRCEVTPVTTGTFFTGQLSRPDTAGLGCSGFSIY
jgi:hypothetical protein